MLNSLAAIYTGGVAAATTAYESIATVTVPAGGSSSTITFSSIPSTYSHLEIRAIAQINTGTEAVIMQFNSDSGNNYALHYLSGNGSGSGAGSSTTRNSLGLFWAMGAPSISNTFAGNITTILDYANTSKYKTIKALDGFDGNGSGAIELASGLWQSTSAITSIVLTPNSGKTFSQYSQFALYGVK